MQTPPVVPEDSPLAAATGASFAGQGGGGGGGKGGQGALHVYSATADQHPVDDLRSEGVMAPGAGVAYGHHIGVSGEAQVRAGRAPAGIEVFDLAKPHAAAVETQPGQFGLQDVHRPGVSGGHRRAADKVLGQADGIEAAHDPCS